MIGDSGAGQVLFRVVGAEFVYLIERINKHRELLNNEKIEVNQLLVKANCVVGIKCYECAEVIAVCSKNDGFR